MAKRNRNVFYLFCLIVMVIIFAPLSILRADTVELKTGERIEGTFKQATLNEVTIEVGGQTLKFQLEKVRAITFGSAPLTNVPISNLQEAVDSLKALRSVVEVGIIYKDYDTRVLDTKIKVDRYLQMHSQGNAKAKASVSKAMNYYLLALNVWQDKIKYEAGLVIDEPNYVTRSRRLCKHLERGFAMAEEEWVAERLPVLKDETQREYEISRRIFTHYLIPALWSCASDKTLEAETYLKEKPN